MNKTEKTNAQQLMALNKNKESVIDNSVVGKRGG